MTVEDPKTFTRPFTFSVHQRLMPDTELIEFVCGENNLQCDEAAMTHRMRHLFIGLALGGVLGAGVGHAGRAARRRQLSRWRYRGSKALSDGVRERRGALHPRQLRPRRQVGDAPAPPGLHGLPDRSDDELRRPGWLRRTK